MAVELVRQVWCDIEMKDNRRVESVWSGEVALDGHAVVLDLCAQHEAQFVTPIRDLLSFGTDTKKLAGPAVKRTSVANGSENADGRIPCPVEGCKTPKPLKNRASLQVHIRQQHGMTMRAAFADQEVEPTENLQKIKCPVGWCTANLISQDSLADHTRRKHPELAEQNGRQPAFV